MRGRFVAGAVLAVLAGGCASGLEEAGESLSPGPSAPDPSATSLAPSSPEPRDGVEPAIIVSSPGAGDEVVSPVTISGTANVFEATVSVRVLDASGVELAAGFATATCGSGCRGEFSTELSFFTEVRQPGTVELFEVSAENGSPINLVSIAVVLVPGS